MNTNMFFRGTVAFLFFVCTTNLVSAQESLFRLPMQTQIQQSDLVVEGKVVSKSSFWDTNHQNIYTSHVIEVFKVFKGQSQSTIEIITPGGVVDLEAEVVSNSLRLRGGDIGVFLLSQVSIDLNTKVNTVSKYKSVSAKQGFYKYSIENDIAINPFEVYNGISSNLYTTISEHTKSSIIELTSFDVAKKVLETKTINNRIAPPIIDSFSATDNSAGTGSVLTIIGANFGSSQGDVGFRDADLGGVIFTNTLNSQILSWTDSQIEVEIPEHSGTGNFRVSTTNNGSVVSAQDLTIDFAQINLNFDLGSGDIAYQTQHIDNNGNGGNTWEMNIDFYNSDARVPFEDALQTWTCGTGVNWGISSSTTTNTIIENDDQNIVTFNSLSAGLLGQCTSRYSGCVVGTEIQWYVEELDIVFNSNINWNFTNASPASNQVDFQSVAVHELGHGQQLGHVIDNDLIMHFSLPGGVAQRDLSEEDLRGAADIMSRTTTNTACNQPIMLESDCFIANSALSTDDFSLENNITLSPNPASSETFLRSTKGTIIDRISIYNVEGKMVFSDNYSIVSTQRNINVNNLSRGLYFVNITSDNSMVTKKLIVN